MRSLDIRVDDFMQAPVAAAMFVLADRLGLSAGRLAAPATVTALASTALRDLNPWDGQAAANRVRALALVGPLRDLVTAVVTDVRNAWWSAPLDRGAQLLLTGQDDPQRDPMHLQTPHGPNDAWETYAQKPVASIATSTELPVARDEPIRSGAHAELSCGISDWDAVYPVHQVRLQVSSTARVYAVDSAADWHRLVQRYQDPATHPGSDDSLRNAAGIDNGPAPPGARSPATTTESTSPSPACSPASTCPAPPRRSAPPGGPGTGRAPTGCGQCSPPPQRWMTFPEHPKTPTSTAHGEQPMPETDGREHAHAADRVERRRYGRTLAMPRGQSAAVTLPAEDGG